MKLLLAALLGTLLIPIPQWGTVSLIEGIWTLVGIVAVIVSLLSMPKVVVDYVVTKHAPRGKLADARTLLARGHVRRELIRLSQAFIILAVGLFADFQPNPLTSITLTGLALTSGLVALAALVGLQSMLDRMQREQAEALLREQEASDE